MLRSGRVQPASHVVGADWLNGVVEVDQDDARLLRLTCKRPAAGQNQQTQKAVHGTGCPLLSICCLIPRATEFCGSSFSALLTSAAAAGFWLACRSSRANTRYALMLGCVLSDSVACARASLASPSCSLTSASPAWASALSLCVSSAD